MSKGSRSLAVLFIHGIGGHYHQFTDWPQIVSQYGDAETFFLPGHGGTFEELLNTKIEAFHDDVNSRLQRLREKYNDIILVGHSMGTLLSLKAAYDNPKKIKALFLWAVPFGVSFYSSTQRMLRYHFGHDTSFSLKDNFNHLFSVTHPTPLQAVRILPLLRDIIALAREVKEIYPDIAIPITAFQVLKDELISSEESVDILRKNPKAEITVLIDSSHGFLGKRDAKTVKDAFKKLLSDMTTASLPEDNPEPII